MNNEIFNARIEEINGKKVLVIKPKIEEIINEDGTKDVIIHAPSIQTISQTKIIGGLN